MLGETRTQLIGLPPGVGPYPFTPGQERGSVEDLFLYVDNPDVVPPVRLDSPTDVSSWSLGSTPDFRFLDATDAVVFDTTAAAHTVRDWGAGFTLHTWTLNDDRLAVLVREEEGLAVPNTGVLDERAWDSARPSLRTLVVNGEEVTEGRVELYAGYNADLTADASGVTIAAVPGAGEGFDPDCGTDRAPLRTVSRVPGNARGEFRLHATDCLTVVPGTSTLIIRADCGPCAPCDAFVRVYKAMKKIDTAYATVGSRADTVRDTYSDVVDRWNEQKACREARMLRVSATAYTSGIRRCAAVLVTLCNATRVCLTDVVVRLDWTTSRPGITGEIMANTTVIYYSDGRAAPYTLSGAWPNWTGGWPSVDPGRSVKLKFSICFTGELPGDYADLVATASAAGRPDFATDSVRITLS